MSEKRDRKMVPLKTSFHKRLQVLARRAKVTMTQQMADLIKAEEKRQEQERRAVAAFDEVLP